MLSASSLARISEQLSGVRSSWLMLARNSLLYWFARSSSAALSVSTACACARSSLLRLEQLRLLLELRVDLLQLGLLALEARLRLLQRAALLLELLVADAQLFLLRLQLLGLALRLLEQLLEARAVLRRADGDAERLGDARPAARAPSRSDPPEEAELDHRLHDAVDDRGRDQELAWRAPGRAPTRPAGSRRARRGRAARGRSRAAWPSRPSPGRTRSSVGRAAAYAGDARGTRPPARGRAHRPARRGTARGTPARSSPEHLEPLLALHPLGHAPSGPSAARSASRGRGSRATS